MSSDYCRYSSSKCPSFRLDKKKTCISSCKKLGKTISITTPKGGNIKSPPWCPKKQKH